MTNTPRLLTSGMFALAMVAASPPAHADPTTSVEPSLAVKRSRSESHAGRTMRTAGWLTLGGGAASLVGAAVMYRLASRVPDDAPPSELTQQTTSVRNEHRAGQILLYTGVVAAVTGVSLILFAPADSTAPSVSVSLNGLTLSGRF
jgi:hypothetical protein